MTDKPSYLGLLNTISNAETAAEGWLSAWADVTPRDDVRQILRTVALREGEHGKAFEKRICELGFGLVERTDDRAAERCEIASSRDLTDRQKFEKLGLVGGDPNKPDVFSSMFADQSIDIQTGALLGRYIAEERDSGRMFRGCYEQLCAEESASNGVASNGAAKNGAGSDQLARIEALLCQLVEKIGA
ncbi:MAG: hypothetical protein OEY23_07710 [Acidimicrobiia bacterium]|nr:hypothetical protein [Acidimicrobiia bacterium]